MLLRFIHKCIHCRDWRVMFVEDRSLVVVSNRRVQACTCAHLLIAAVLELSCVSGSSTNV